MEKRDCLILDDDSDFLELTARLLEAKGLEVEKAETVAEAISKLELFEFKSISLDITLEAENAAEVLVYLNKEVESINSKSRIIICSSHVTDDFKFKMEKRNIKSFCKKSDLEFYYDELVNISTISLVDQMDQAFEDNIDIEDLVDGAVKEMLNIAEE